jgi:hypothetical protein
MARVDDLQRARRICLALPEAAEKIAWGAPTFRVRNKMFAIFADNHHNDGRIALWCKAPKWEQEHRVEEDPERYFVPPYVGVQGWIGLQLNRFKVAEVQDLVEQAYCMVAPKGSRKNNFPVSARHRRSWLGAPTQSTCLVSEEVQQRQGRRGPAKLGSYSCAGPKKLRDLLEE